MAKIAEGLQIKKPGEFLIPSSHFEIKKSHSIQEIILVKRD